MSTTARKCTYRRCANGTVRLASGMDTTCMRCGGTGRIPSVEICRELDASEVRRYQLLHELDAAARLVPGRDGNHMTVLEYVQEGRIHLSENHPDRYARMLDAIEGGRVEQVVTCLRDYAQVNIYGNGPTV